MMESGSSEKPTAMSPPMSRLCLLLILLAVSRTLCAAAPAADFENEIRPLLVKYCQKCHSGEKPKGEFNLTQFKTKSSIQTARSDWRKVLTVVKENEMPPDDPLPTPAERQKIVEWVEAATKIDWSKVKNPGHVTIPRLTRDEYNNTMRDLLGVDLRPGDTFSQDGEGQSGFTTDRDSLFVTPSMMEKYFDAAERSLSSLIAIRKRPVQIHLESEKMFMTETKETPKQFGDDFFGYVINRGQMTLYDSVNFPADGWYEFRIRALSTDGPTGSRLRINDVVQGDFYVPERTPQTATLRVFVRAGSHQVAWNIEKGAKPRPGSAAAKRAKKLAQKEAEARSAAAKAATEAKKNPLKAYRKLPGDANGIVTREATKHAPKFPATGKEAAPVKILIQRLDNAAYSLQRPYEWLRLLSTDGDPNEIVRFRGYVVDRTETLNLAKDALARAIGTSLPQFEKLYNEANEERIADNRILLARVKDVKAVARQPRGRPQRTSSTKPGNVAIDWVEVRGPILPKTASAKSLVFFVTPKSDEEEPTVAREIIGRFAQRAFRRPVDAAEVDRFVSLYEKVTARGDDFEDSVKLALAGVLVSPHFLFRVEAGPGDDEFRLNDFQLASRLSYFLWMSMPDDELIELAAKGTLREPGVLRQQVRQMLADPKAETFSRSFTGQWLGYAALGIGVKPDAKQFPQFTPELAEAMKQEPTLFLLSLLREDRSLLELLDSETTYLNADLARLYGISGVEEASLQPIVLKDRNRGGLLGMASVLTATSSATRTSPVIRGKWVLETLLGRKLPEPPADAGELPGNAGEARTLREELLRHRRNPTCATCHDKIDPIGFGLENFDAIGRFRTKQARKPIDAKGELPDGTIVDGPVELKQYLKAKKKTEFTRNVTRRMLAFALGRELQYFDEPAVGRILAAVEADDYRAAALIEQIVLSYPFQFQTGRVPEE
jgi:hypothetical protein